MPQTQGLHLSPRPCIFFPRPLPSGSREQGVAAGASRGDISEDVLARLRAAEDEAVQLRKQLADARVGGG